MLLLLPFVTLREARNSSFLSFLHIENTETLFFTKTEESISIRSSYRDKRPNSSYLFVQAEDPKVLQVVNVTKTLSDVTNFVINLVTDEEGETNLTIQLWVSEGRRERLIDEMKGVRVQVLKGRMDRLPQASMHIDRRIELAQIQR